MFRCFSCLGICWYFMDGSANPSPQSVLLLYLSWASAAPTSKQTENKQTDKQTSVTTIYLASPPCLLGLPHDHLLSSANCSPSHSTKTRVTFSQPPLKRNTAHHQIINQRITFITTDSLTLNHRHWNITHTKVPQTCETAPKITPFCEEINMPILVSNLLLLCPESIFCT